jgi:hypothetical protein
MNQGRIAAGRQGRVHTRPHRVEKLALFQPFQP